MTKKNSTWEEAILKVLKEKQKPLKYTQIYDIISEQGLLETQSATPYNTINRYLQILCEKHKVVKVGAGIFVLTEFASNFQGSEQIIEATENNDVDEAEKNTTTQNPISAYGRFWSRDIWESTNYQLYGVNFIKKISGSKPLSGVSVDFTDAQGIYLLHKGYQVVYVGRAGEGRLGHRLEEHTLDSLRNRWDSFSWFSIDPIEKEDKLSNYTIKQEDLLAALEALLIETVGPELNMKRGDNFSDKEFEQISESDFYRLKQK